MNDQFNESIDDCFSFYIFRKSQEEAIKEQRTKFLEATRKELERYSESLSDITATHKKDHRGKTYYAFNGFNSEHIQMKDATQGVYGPFGVVERDDPFLIRTVKNYKRSQELQKDSSFFTKFDLWRRKVYIAKIEELNELERAKQEDLEFYDLIHGMDYIESFDVGTGERSYQQAYIKRDQMEIEILNFEKVDPILKSLLDY